MAKGTGRTHSKPQAPEFICHFCERRIRQFGKPKQSCKVCGRRDWRAVGGER